MRKNMKDISFDLLNLFKKYGVDEKQILKENVNLDYLYALSGQRENVIEWFPFRQDARLLQVGADYGALTGLYARKVKEVHVLEENRGMIEVVKARCPDSDNIWFEEESLKDHSLGQAGSYDYVMLIGSLTKPYESELKASKALLKPDGTLILAVCNRFGMKYWAGCQREENCLSGKQLKALLGEDGTARWYYPMPDYRIPITIYAEDYLPKKGDLTHTITAYDYPKYIRMDIGEKYDEVCEDGEFETYANSFLVIWKKNGAPAQKKDGQNGGQDDAD